MIITPDREKKLPSGSWTVEGGYRELEKKPRFVKTDCTLIWQNRRMFQIGTVMFITSYQASTPLTPISSDPWVPSSDHRHTDLMVTLYRAVCSQYKTVECSSNFLVDSCQAHLMSHLSSQDLRKDLFPDSSLWRHPRGPRGT